MAWPLRVYECEGIYFVTCRTFQGRMLMRPSDTANALIGGVLARACDRFNIELFGYVFLSTHFHLLIRAPKGTHSQFMQYLLSNISRKVGRAINWTGSFWSRRYSAERVIDEDALVGRLSYILAHGVKEKLVGRCLEWPGLSCVDQLLKPAAHVFHWFNWTKRWNKRRTRNVADTLVSDDVAEAHELRLLPLPGWATLSETRRCELIAGLVAEIEAKHEGQPVLGRAAVLRQDPHFRPEKVSRSPRPPAHSASHELLVNFVREYRDVVATFREASVKWRSGDFFVPFPASCFRPPILSFRGQPSLAAA